MSCSSTGCGFFVLTNPAQTLSPYACVLIDMDPVTAWVPANKGGVGE